MAKYSNSSLATVHIPSPNYQPRTYAQWGNPNGVIDKITIHHMAGNATVEAVGNQFANPDRWASATYGIGTDGRIAQYVDEQYCPWTSSNLYNDSRAVTIEVANCQGAPNWEISDKAYASLIKLVTDICKRNNIKKLNYTGDSNGNLTMHCMFAATACPGPYLKSKFPVIAEEVNKNLNGSVTPTPAPTTFVVNDIVKVSKDAVVYNTTRPFADFVYKMNMYVTSVPKSGDRIVISTSKGGATTGAVAAKYLTKVTPKSTTTTPSKSTQLPGYTGVITYRAFAGNKWWGEIKSSTLTGTSSYAGYLGKPITALCAKAEYGKIWMSIHTVGGNWSEKKEVSNTTKYIGSNVKQIDGVRIWSETGHVDFRVHTVNGKWWSWIDSRNCNNTDYNSYAGLLGTPIDAIQMK